MRVCVLGSAGSGKTTLAKKLSKKMECDWIEMDYIVYKEIDKEWKRSQQDKIDSEVRSFIGKESWVVEGVFMSKQILETADKIYILDENLPVRIFRIWKRYFTDEANRQRNTFWGTISFAFSTIKRTFFRSSMHQNLKFDDVKNNFFLYLNKEALEWIKSNFSPKIIT